MNEGGARIFVGGFVVDVDPQAAKGFAEIRVYRGPFAILEMRLQDGETLAIDKIRELADAEALARHRASYWN